MQNDGQVRQNRASYIDSLGLHIFSGQITIM